jgi:multiple sugar transport system ATP-binding protein
MRTEIARLQRELGVTTIYFTHDQVEAMTMADRVAVMRGGELQQFDTPQRVYANPANLFVGVFIGSPAMNVLEGELSRGEGGAECRIGPYRLPIPEAILVADPALARSIGRTVAVGIRPEAIAVTPGDNGGLRGTVIVSEELGSEVISHVEVEAKSVRDEAIVEGLSDEASSGSGAAARAPDDGKSVVVARLPAEADYRRGTSVSLEFAPHRLHFFDPESGETLRSTSRCA